MAVAKVHDYLAELGGAMRRLGEIYHGQIAICSSFASGYGGYPA